MAQENSFFFGGGRGWVFLREKAGKLKKETIHLLYVSTYWDELIPDIILDVYRCLSLL